MKYVKLLIAALTIGLTITACEGPAGPQGPAGEQGPLGEQGPQGEEGNANIMYSDWMDIQWDEESDDYQKSMVILESRITADFLNDGGLVLMFMKAEGSGGVLLVYSLPLLTGIDGNFHFRFVTIVEEEAQGIVLLLLSLDGTTAIPDNLWNNLQIRYVIIPGSDNISAMNGIDITDYNQLAKQFEIRD